MTAKKRAKKKTGPIVPGLPGITPTLEDIAKRRGRPFKPYDPELLPVVKRLCGKLGLTEFEVCAALDISDATLRTWKAQHPELLRALRVGKAVANRRVEATLFHRAIGYSFPSEEIFMVDSLTTRIRKDGTKLVTRMKKAVRVPTVEHVPPSEGAAKLWLTNRDERRWRERKVLEHTNQDGKPFKTEDATPAPPVDLVDAYFKRMARAARGRPDPGAHPDLERDGRPRPGPAGESGASKG